MIGQGGREYLVPQACGLNPDFIGVGDSGNLLSKGYSQVWCEAHYQAVHALNPIDATNDTCDWLALQWCAEKQGTVDANSNTSYTGVTLGGGHYFVNGKSILLKKLPDTRSQQMKWYGQGGAFVEDLGIVALGSDRGIFDLTPTDQAEAEEMISRGPPYDGMGVSYAFYDMFIYGATNGKGMNIGATLQSHFEKVHCEGFQICWDLQFMLQAMLLNCGATNGEDASLYIRNGQWTDADIDNSQSNRFTVIGFRSYVPAGGANGIIVEGCSGGRIMQIVTEGSSKATPDSHVKFDNVSSQFCKDFVLDGMHCEGAAPDVDENSAAIKFVTDGATQMHYVVRNIFNQISNINLIYSDNSTSGTVDVQNISYTAGGVTFRTLGQQNTGWRVRSCKIVVPGNFLAAGNWNTTGGGFSPTAGDVDYLQILK